MPSSVGVVEIRNAREPFRRTPERRIEVGDVVAVGADLRGRVKATSAAVVQYYVVGAIDGRGSAPLLEFHHDVRRVGRPGVHTAEEGVHPAASQRQPVLEQDLNLVESRVV